MLKSVSAKVSEVHKGERFDVAATYLFPNLSRKRIKNIIDSGGAYLNKKRIKIAKTEVKLGDKIELFWEEVGSDNVQNSSIKQLNIKNNLDIKLDFDTLIFENDLFYIINKPAGVASQATLTSSTDTIFHLLNIVYPQKFDLKKMFLVHRLDKDTSGLMVIAKNTEVQKKFENLFRDKLIEKNYLALCFYKPKQAEGELGFPIAKDSNRKNCYFAITNPNSKNKNAKEAFTRYKLLNYYSDADISLLSCFPKTGRTHQIRVHLNAIGCPILGDKTYSQNIYGHKYYQIALRHMLHACYLKFQLDGQNFEFNLDMPKDFKSIIETIEAVK